eukprot:CAMPEP_0171285762 /NCGR_PEP_ID=MMETSP0790-20130122/68643_1 /TAXON_ID=2925 /ORGANISM="Alexandrium catenella, Strain OF101" /LENGTH=78 /DNA_ID=CAMNT_0011755143 /DNA_START=37 /DNA_END=271 /DNA_ORIENTATION=+
MQAALDMALCAPTQGLLTSEEDGVGVVQHSLRHVMCRRRLRGHAACLDADGRERVLHLDDEPQGPRLHVLALGEDDDG